VKHRRARLSRRKDFHRHCIPAGAPLRPSKTIRNCIPLSTPPQRRVRDPRKTCPPARLRKVIRDREMIEAVEAQTASPLGREVAAPGAEAHEPDSAAPEMRGATPPKRSEIELEAKPASLRLREHAEPQMTESVPPAPHAAAPGIPAAAPVIETGEHTEIHISIGSIELRAPRTEEKASPFRPRVTLAEFLRRRPGAES